jgi:hypothetical protein
MAIKTFTTGEVLTASDTNTYLANSGLVAVTPSAVTNGTIISGTASATVNATQSTVVLKDVFSSTFDSYRVVISNLTMSNTLGTTNMFAKLHDGTNPASTNYNYGIVRIDMASSAVQGTGAQGSTNGVLFGSGTGDKFGASFDVINPNLATHTLFNGLQWIQVSGGYSGAGGGMHQTSTAYTSLQIAPSTGTMTGGTITVYGYRK